MLLNMYDEYMNECACMYEEEKLLFTLSNYYIYKYIIQQYILRKLIRHLSSNKCTRMLELMYKTFFINDNP